LAAAQTIDTGLSPYHALVTGPQGNRPIDTILSDLAEMQANLSRNAIATAPNDQTARRLSSAIDKLSNDATQLPQPFQRLLKTLASDARQESSEAAVAEATKRLRDTITYACQETITSRFPFRRDATRDVTFDDFNRMFSPRGLIDKFMSDHVLAFIDKPGGTSGGAWKWRTNAPLAKVLSATALADFQRAAEIRDAYFAESATTASFALSVTPPALAGARLDIDQTSIVGRQNPTASQVRWPGTDANHRVALTYEQSGKPPATIQANGLWALHRVLDSGTMAGDGTATFKLGEQELRFRFEPNGGTAAVNLSNFRGFHCPSGT
jgi:type VI secretion system protein ImpL